MRPAFFLVLLSLSVFALDYPPHQNVSAHNGALGPSLLNSSCANRSTPDYDHPIICAEAELLAVYPSVDYRISGERQSDFLWRYAYSATSQDKTMTDSCGCTSYYHKTFQDAVVLANLSAIFINATYIIANLSENPEEVPVSPDILNQTQGDNLTLVLDATIIFRYMYDSTVCHCDANCSCSVIVNPSEEHNLTRNTKTNLTYEVEGGSLLHFLSKPVLREQWAKDSQFEDLVFSKRKFYYSSLSLGSNETGNATFYTFDIVNVSNNSFNVWGIVSHPVSNFTNLDEKEMKERTTPVPIEIQNDTHVYIYDFNSSYQFFGQHEITLSMSDHFGSNFSETFSITNRLLTSGNATAENGETNITDRSLYRPSVKFGEKTSSLLIANVSLIGALALLFVFLRR